MDSFLVLGHGIESPVNFEKRATIPEGIVLVTIAECGIVTRTEDVCPIVEAFSNPDNAAIFAEPRRNKAAITGFLNGKDVHIFEAGDKYPTLMLQMFLDWSQDEYTEIFKSGLYTFPIVKDEFMIGEGDTFCNKLYTKMGPYKGFSQTMPADFDAKQMFKGSLYPTDEEVLGLVDTHRKKSQAIKKAVTVPLETLFEKGGPGVYYYVVCRHPKDIYSPNNLVSNVLQVKNNEKFKPYYGNDWISKLNTLIPLLENYKATRNPAHWNYLELNDTIKSYKQLQRVPEIRRKSIVQQEGKGLTRKKRRQTQRGTRMLRRKT